MQKPNIFECDALGTHWWVTFSNQLELENSRSKLLTTINKFERTFSRFRETSLLSQLNNNKILTNPSSELVEILESCLEFYSHTNGLFNISIGSQLEKDGYGRVADSSSTVSNNLIKDLIVNDSTIILSPTMRIDLGGIGKGWLIDKLAKTLHTTAPSGFIINGGGDIYVSLDYPTDLALEHPLNDKEYIGTVDISKGALAVSSPLKRTWKHNGSSKTHIIHPSKQTTAHYISAYVRAESATVADVLATILLIADESERDSITAFYEIDYILVRPDMSSIMSPGFNAQLF